MLNRGKPLTTIAGPKKAKEKALEPAKLERNPQKTTLRRTEPYKLLKRTKPLICEEGPARNSNKQHSENTYKWHLCKTGSFSYHRGPLPFRELHSTGETPRGSWARLPPVYKCNHPATVCDTCGLCPKQNTKKTGTLGNSKKIQTTRRRAG